MTALSIEKRMLDPNTRPAYYTYAGDCIPMMRGWCGQFKADLIFADPPFNVGEEYLAHDDNMPYQEFCDFTCSWLDLTASLLRPGGVMVINIPDAMVGLVLSLCPLRRIDWCIWHYRFGQAGSLNNATKFISSHTHILVYRKGEQQHTFRAADVAVESLRSSKYNDKRTFDSETPGMRAPLDVWDIPRVVGNSRERVPECPNQLPEAYLERVIKAYSRPGDCVFDPFGGSFTTAAVAARFDRWSVTIEKSERLCELGNQRVQRVLGELFLEGDLTERISR